MGLVILGVFCMLWAVATSYIALAKPEKMWKMGKIQGFVQMLGETGATILFLVLAAGMAVLGVWLTFLR
jgi:hypothetical protein